MVIILLSNMSSGDAYFGITYLQYVGGPGKIEKNLFVVFEPVPQLSLH